MGTKISEATLRETLKGSESLPIVDTDLPKGRTTIDILKSYVQPDLSGKQDKLVSGTNIKTVNGESILGSGDLAIDNVYVISEEVYNTIYSSGTLGLDKVEEIKEAIRNNRGIVLEYNGRLNTLSDYQQNEEDQYLGLSFISQDATYSAVTLYVIMLDINTGTGETEVTNNLTPSLTIFGEQNHYLSGTGEYIQIPEVPTKTSDLYNDSNFITMADVEKKDFATKDELNKKVSTDTYTSDKATFATKTELGTKLDTSTYNSEKSSFATKAEVQAKLDTSTYTSDKATFATKTELSAKVSGTGVTSIQVVTELPESPTDGVLYIVQESEEETA